MEDGYGNTPLDCLKALKKEAGLRSVERLLVLDRTNDPWNYGAPAHIKQAEWFRELWEAVGYRGAHVRRMHYRVYEADHPYLTLDGESYDNVIEHRDMMEKASKSARMLGFVDADDFVDRRAPRPSISVGDGGHLILRAGRATACLPAKSKSGSCPTFRPNSVRTWS